MRNEHRIRRLIEQAILTFDLDLSGLRVLTEAATGYYALTPLIAALAGAERVYTLSRDSRFGTAVAVQDSVLELAERWGLAKTLEPLTSRNDPRLSNADVVTNLGFVRPLDAPFLARLKPTAAIPLMWETWEYRPEDLDLAACRQRGIPVLGTDEHHPDLSVFTYVGHLALKLLLALDIELFRSDVAVLGSGEFAQEALRSLEGVGARARLIAPAELASEAAQDVLRQSDALVVVEHHARDLLIGPGGGLEAERLAALNPGLVIAHICGGADREALENQGLRCHPERFAAAGYMSVATDHMGPRPLIDLHTAGLRVGADLARARLAGLGAFETERVVLAANPFAQGFAGYHEAQEVRMGLEANEAGRQA